MEYYVCVYVCLCVLSLVQLFCGPVDCSPPGFSVHGILQARILERVAVSPSRGICLTQGWNLCLLHCGQVPLRKPMEYYTEVKKGMVVWIQIGSQCLGCLRSWSCRWLGAVVHCSFPVYRIVLYCTLLAQERLRVQNLKHRFCWVHIALALL